MKKCELCDSPAKMYCESDRASLCWDCDARVHGANFLVAKHSRTLLCRVCQSLTAWNGSGAKLSRTVSVCEKCVSGYSDNKSRNDDQEEDEDHDDDHEDRIDDDHDDGDCTDEEDEENQVVPWSDPAPAIPSSSRCASVSHSETAFSLRGYRRR